MQNLRQGATYPVISLSQGDDGALGARLLYGWRRGWENVIVPEMMEVQLDAFQLVSADYRLPWKKRRGPRGGWLIEPDEFHSPDLLEAFYSAEQWALNRMNSIVLNTLKSSTLTSTDELLRDGGTMFFSFSPKNCLQFSRSQENARWFAFGSINQRMCWVIFEPNSRRVVTEIEHNSPPDGLLLLEDALHELLL
ncbi:hypothetical protein [Salinarimonas sp.]|uniref:hypothetical protein n=1 Tax=Salinarimonas sp. TaxID=2766526 RepID=UPI003919EBBD